tara:strand:- start:1040 stop:1789 length:750 start_codon:yes stop_codon:yes gene_type:complete
MQKKIIVKEINKHFKSLKIKKKDNIIIHSNLLNFGIYHKNLPNLFIKSLLNLIGKDGTLVMPLYNLGLNKNKVINLKKDYNKKINSILSIYFFKNYKVAKSNSIFHSHIAFGKLKKIFLKSSFNSFGKNSDFDILHKNNFKLILFGCDANEGCTYLHHIEHILNVDYRYNKTFKFKILNNRKIVNIKTIYKVKKDKIRQNLNKLFFNYKIRKYTNLAKLKYGNSYSIKIKELHKVSYNILIKNKKALIK